MVNVMTWIRTAAAGLDGRAHHLAAATRAAANTAVCLLKVYPMLPSRPLNWVTPRPVIEQVVYATAHGPVTGQLYRPDRPGPHPGVVVCLGVVPFGVNHPQVPRLGEALARSGFATLLYWSPAMRDFRLDPGDRADIASAYAALLDRPDIDPAHSGIVGTCVGGAFGLMAAAQPAIRERVAFVLAYAPYASMWTLARDIASASHELDGERTSWPVDPLTRKVFVHSVTASLEAAETARLRATCAERGPVPVMPDLSADGQALLPLLGAVTADEAATALRHLPPPLQQYLDALSPEQAAADIHAPLVVLLHDHDDPVIPVGESRRLRRALPRTTGTRYTEFTVFRHLDPSKGSASKLALTRELLRFARAIYPLYKHVQHAKSGVRNPPHAAQRVQPVGRTSSMV